jgi:hypothetical protein
VIVSSALERTSATLAEGLGLGEPFHDPGVGEFGLENAVFALGDCFLEVISPTRPETAAGRYMQAHGGDGGYMAIFDLEDLDGARERAAALGVRVVWQIDLPDISGTHLHPRDMRGAIVSLDRSIPYGSWRWGGPRWTARIPTPAPGRLTGITIAVAEPAKAAARWAEVLGVAPGDAAEPKLVLENAEVRFARAFAEADEGLVEIAVKLPAGLEASPRGLDIGSVGVRWR